MLSRKNEKEAEHGNEYCAGCYRTDQKILGKILTLTQKNKCIG